MLRRLKIYWWRKRLVFKIFITSLLLGYSGFLLYDQLQYPKISKRIVQQETVLWNEVNSGISNLYKHWNLQDAFSNASTTACCGISENDTKLYPHCYKKMKWMKDMWESDPCYAAYGVDGSSCSSRIYLSDVEHFCPPLKLDEDRSYEIEPSADEPLAIVNLSLDGLLSRLSDDSENYDWVRSRIRSMWTQWSFAGRWLQRRKLFQSRKKLKVLIHLGLLTKQSGFSIAKGAGKGGPLGELVQWSDLAAGLWLLGHEVHITSQTESLTEFLKKDAWINSPCPAPRQEKLVDLIYTDIIGLRQIKRITGDGYYKCRCKLRILDSFGTEPALNHYSHMKERNMKSAWGGNNLDTSQFLTLYPHTPDNRFLGFVVDAPSPARSDRAANSTKNIALVYGKLSGMWKGMRAYLDVVSRYIAVHATVAESRESDGDTTDAGSVLPPYVVNHGVVPPDKFFRLLSSAKYFVGLGFPFEGPAPLEAIAHGAIFLNPMFYPPKSRNNTKFFEEKPTFRKLTSQVPYAENVIGSPHVISLDVNNLTRAEQLIRSSLKTEVPAFVPYEFTYRGFLERLVAYTAKAPDLCEAAQHLPLTNDSWPSRAAMVVVLGPPLVSCVDACHSRGLICERTFFKYINSVQAFNTAGIQCDHINSTLGADIHLPILEESSIANARARAHGRCTLQADELLFSCAGKSGVKERRLCPCRNYRREQSALCLQCLE